MTSGDCPGCGGKLTWGGSGYREHTPTYHDGVRTRLLRAFMRSLDREANLKAWRAQNAVDGFIGIRWRCGVYPGWQSERRWELPYEWWDSTLAEGDQGFILRAMREHLSCLFEIEHGVKVNPATWFHKIYDGRTGSTP